MPKKGGCFTFGVWGKMENNWLKREVGLSLKIAILWAVLSRARHSQNGEILPLFHVCFRC